MATLADGAFRRARSLLAIADERRAGVLGSGTTPPEEGNVDTTWAECLSCLDIGPSGHLCWGGE